MFKIGDKILFTGGYGQSEFKLKGEITGSFIESRPNIGEYIVYTFLLETGSWHYGYPEQLELI